MAAATETSSASSVELRPLSPSPRLRKIKLEEKFNLLFKRRSTTATTTPRPFTSVLSTRKRRKCSLCTPTTHPGSYRCDFHRGLATEYLDNRVLRPKRSRSSGITTTTSDSGVREKIGILGLRPKRRRCGYTTSDSGLNLRKTALMNSLAGMGSVEAERCRKYLKESLVKPLSPRFRCKYRPRPRRSRFYALHNNDQD